MRSLTTALLMTAAFICADSQSRAATALPAVPAATHLADSGPSITAAAPAAQTPPPTATASADPAPVSTLDAAGPDAGTPAATDASQVNPNDSDGIVATVNDTSISDYEVRQRMALFVATSGMQPDAEAKKRIHDQILAQLEDEKIELAEALKKHITVSPAEIDKQINRLIGENRFTIEQLRTTLGNAGTSEAALRSQILAQIAWQKAVEDEYGDRPVVTPEQIDAEMARNAEGANKPHFLVGEIFLPVDNPEQDAKVLKDAQTIESQLSMGAPFPSLARQFSQSPSAAGGGDMGWVFAGQLSPELNAALSKMEPGSVSQPIRGIGGYYILTLRQRQEPLGTKIVQAPTGPTNPDGTLPLARLLLPMGGQPTKNEVDQVMKVAAEIRAHTTSCDQLDKFREKMPGAVYMNLGDTKLTDLSPEIQKVLAQTHPGDVATPFISEAGVEIIARCDKRVITETAYVLPTHQQVEQQLFEQQISALARRYLRDLKRDANIQVRDAHGAMQLASQVH
ncbi:MAG TPA: peptidylprolyl isomerase [Rhizomicrobium sp.]|jgi:peptidyl-prolyl cis-trans isomerase SurA|nr:peptidylprolyl isomerase [Rhizomicrobium sp.]